MALTLSVEAKKLLRPRRSVQDSAVAHTPATALRQVNKLAKAYATNGYSGDRKQHQIYAAGLETKACPELRDARFSAHALLLHKSWDETFTPIRDASIDALAVADRMVTRCIRELDLIPIVAVARGWRDAILVAMRNADIHLAAEGNWTQAVYATTVADERYPPEPKDSLRNMICALDAGAYDEARAFAKGLRAKLDLPHRALLAYVFPDEPWGAEDLDAAHSAPPPATGRRRRDSSYLLSTSPTVEEARRADPHDVARYAIDLACALPEADAVALFDGALPALLQKPKYGPLLKTPPREVAAGLACLRSPAAAAVLARYAQSTILGPTVLAFFADAPELGEALEGAAKGKAKLAEVAARALGKGVKTPAAKPAKAGEIPALLRDRPWRAKVARDARVVPGLAILAPEKLGLPKERVTALPKPLRVGTGHRPMTAAELAKWKKLVTTNGYTHVDYTYSGGPARGDALRVPPAETLWAWNGFAVHAEDVPGIVARFGVDSIPGFVLRHWEKWLDYEEGPTYLDLVTRFVSPRIAPAIARGAQRQKARPRLLAWLRAHPEEAALGLVPDAVGEPGDARTNAEWALAYLVRRGETAAVRNAGKAYGKPALAIVEALLARDPLASGVGCPKPPSFLRRERLPAVLLRNGRALDDPSTSALLEMLQAHDADPPYAGIALLRDACDEGSLAAFALELFEQWVMADAPGRHDWMLDALVHFPSDASARRLAALAREWARKNQAKAIRACHALAALGTDFALMHLSHVAETTRFDALRKEAASALAGAAEARGLSDDELGDRTVGDWTALGKDGTLTLDYGARAFTVTLDEQLAPVVRERGAKGELGPSATSLPRPTKTDDAQAAAAARATLDTLKADLTQLGARQLKRLERAMVKGREWTAADFRERLATHPLLGHLARRLVWVALPKKGASCTFRLAEDGSFADARDRAYVLPESARVRLAHPAADELASDWAKVLGDYEILQPFPQVGREHEALSTKERGAKELARTAGLVVRATKILGSLEARGWTRDSAGNVGAYQWSLREPTVVARLPIRPGISMEDLRSASDQTTGALTVERDGKPVKLDALDAVSVAEVLRDVEALRG